MTHFTWIDAIGTIGGFLFSTACVPMAVKTIRKGHDIGNPLSTMWTFFGATLCFTVYMIAKVGWESPGFIFGLIEFVCWTLALATHYWPHPHDGLPEFKDFGPDGDVTLMCSLPSMHQQECNGAPRKDCPGCWNDLPFKEDPTQGPLVYNRDPKRKPIGLCTRPAHTEGPCNGWPRRDCPMTEEARKKFYPR